MIFVDASARSQGVSRSQCRNGLAPTAQSGLPKVPCGGYYMVIFTILEVVLPRRGARHFFACGDKRPQGARRHKAVFYTSLADGGKPRSYSSLMCRRRACLVAPLAGACLHIGKKARKNRRASSSDSYRKPICYTKRKGVLVPALRVRCPCSVCNVC
jgi:hypothetical protein